jgi:hypothetical protein
MDSLTPAVTVCSNPICCHRELNCSADFFMMLSFSSYMPSSERVFITGNL